MKQFTQKLTTHSFFFYFPFSILYPSSVLLAREPNACAYRDEFQLVPYWKWMIPFYILLFEQGGYFLQVMFQSEI